MSYCRYETRYVVAPKGMPWDQCKRYGDVHEARKHLAPGLVLIECQVCYEMFRRSRIMGVGDIIAEG